MALAILAKLASLGDLGKLDCSVSCSSTGAIELGSTITVQTRCYLGCQIISLTVPVSLVLWALRNLASLLLMLLICVHGEAPRLGLALVRITAIIVVAQTVAPLGHNTSLCILLINWLSGVSNWLDLGRTVPRM